MMKQKLVSGRQAIGMSILVALAVTGFLVIGQISANNSAQVPGVGNNVGSLIEANGITVTLEDLTSDGNSTRLQVSYSSTDGSVIELLGDPTLEVVSGERVSVTSAKTISANSNGTGSQLEFEFPGELAGKALSVNLGSVVRYAHDSVNGEVAIAGDIPAESPETITLELNQEIALGTSAHVVETIKLFDDRFEASGGQQFFSIRIAPMAGGSAEQVFSGGVAESRVADNFGNEYTVVGVSTAFSPESGNQKVQWHELVLEGTPPTNVASLNLRFSHFGSIVGPWKYELSGN